MRDSVISEGIVTTEVGVIPRSLIKVVLPAPKSYADLPRSLGAERAERACSSAKWTPRECLIEVLRMIDAGEVTAENLIVAWNEPTKPDENECAHFRTAGPSGLATLGLLTATIFKMQD